MIRELSLGGKIKTMVKTIQMRIPLAMYNDILRIKKQMERETLERFGRKKPVTFTRAAQEFHRRKNQSFFGGSLL